MKEDRSRRSFLISVGTAIASSVAGCLGSKRTPKDSPEKGSVQSNSGRSTSLLYPEMSWNFETMGKVIASPVVCDGYLFCGSHDGYMYAFEDESESTEPVGGYTMFKYNLENTNSLDATFPQGRISEKWKFPTDGRIMSAPAIVGGDVFFGSEGNYFYSISAQTGKKNWSFDTEGMVGAGSPTVHNGVVYFSSGCSKDSMCSTSDESGSLYALDSDSGNQIWSFNIPVGSQSPPMVTEGTVYFGGQDGSYYAVDSETGELDWSFDADAPFCASGAAIMDGNVYVGCEDNKMYALDASDGSLVWNFETDGLVITSPVATENSIYFGSGDGNLYAVDKDTGEEIWSFDANGKVHSSPAYKDGVLYVGSHSSRMFAVEAETGEKVWEYDTDGRIMSSPVVAGDTVYFGSNDGRVYAIENTVQQ